MLEPDHAIAQTHLLLSSPADATTPPTAASQPKKAVETPNPTSARTLAHDSLPSQALLPPSRQEHTGGSDGLRWRPSPWRRSLLQREILWLESAQWRLEGSTHLPHRPSTYA